MRDYATLLEQEMRRRSARPPSLAEIRAREADHRRAWDEDTEQIAQTLPEVLRDGYRLGRWMQWAGHVLQMRASSAAGDERPNRATWARAYRLLEYAEVVMGAATRWMLFQKLTETPRYIFRAGSLEPDEPEAATPPPPAPPPQPLTLARLADAVGLLTFGPKLYVRQGPAPGERLVAQRLVEALTRRRRPVSPMLRAVAGRNR